MLTLLSSVLALLAASAPPPATHTPSADIAEARDLQRDAREAARQGAPVLVVFTRPDCTYCDRVIHYYLEPIQRNPDTARMVLIRRLDITRDDPLVDFTGRATTARAFAEQLKVDFAPTVIVFTPDGHPATRPLIGLGPEDYYGGYLDAAIEAGRQRMKAKHSEK